jgi:hypothetical protein
MSREPSSSLQVFGLFTVAWAAGWCANVWEAWRHAPYDQTGPICAAVWIASLAGLLRAAPPTRLLLGAAWAATLLGTVGSLNVARHLALVLAIWAWIPRIGPRLLAALGAAAWMPATGWILSAWPMPVVVWGRVLLAIVVLGLVWVPHLRRSESLA